MKKLLVITSAIGLAIGMTSPAFAQAKHSQGGPQGGGPGASGPGDKASKFRGPGPGNSFKTGKPGPGNWGPGVGNSNPGQSKRIP